MQKIFIKNRKGQRVAVIVDEAKPQKGLAFVMHGLGGKKEDPHIQMFVDVFLRGGYTTVRFDTTNTFGESDGNYEDATTTNYLEDLEDVITWAATQPWYVEPFCLVGHSLGGICTALYAERYPEKVKALAPISTVVSGKLLIETDDKKNIIAEWERTGYRTTESVSKPGTMKKLKWQHIVDAQRYTLLTNADRLLMPVLLIVGDSDDRTPLLHQQIFFDALPGKKELHIIKGAPHTFCDPKHLAEIKVIFSKWIATLD